MQCLPPGTRLSDHLQPVVCAVYLNDIPLCHETVRESPDDWKTNFALQFGVKYIFILTA